MLDLECEICHNKIWESAALVFGPPDKDDKCEKTHICRRCYDLLFWGINFQMFNWIWDEIERKKLQEFSKK